MIAGPMACTLLADFGAEVIKVEQPSIGDPLRGIGPFVNGESLYWEVEGRNKKSITLNLREQEGQQIVRDLVKKVDVVVENFRPGTMHGWGLSYESLQEVNPKLVMLSVSGFGQTGPYATRAAFDRIALAFSGVLGISGFSDRVPVRPGIPVADCQTALFGAFSVMMALYFRDASSGTGQHIDLSLYETMFRFTDTLLPAYDKLNEVRERLGNLAAAAAPGDVFRTSDNKYLVLTMSNDTMFRKLCLAMEKPDLVEDPRFVSHRQRWAHINDINLIVSNWVALFNAEEMKHKLDVAELAYSLVYDIKDIVSDPQYIERASIQSVDSPRVGTVRMPGIGPRMSVTKGKEIVPAPALGEHNELVYGEWLGFDAERMTALSDHKVI